MNQKRMRSETKWKAASEVYIIKQGSTVCIWKFLIHMEDSGNYCRTYVSVFQYKGQEKGLLFNNGYNDNHDTFSKHLTFVGSD